MDTNNTNNASEEVPVPTTGNGTVNVKDELKSANSIQQGGSSAAAAVAGGGSGLPPRKQRKMDAESDSEEDTQEFDEETQKALEEIDATQNEIDAINEKASDEILKVEQKYNKMRKPFFDKRNSIISKISNFWITAVS